MKRALPGAFGMVVPVVALAVAAACAGRSGPLDLTTVRPVQPTVAFPLAEGSVRFAVIGDSGTGGDAQYEVAKTLARSRERFPFTFVIMLGDNLYGPDAPSEYERAFEVPYKPLLDAGVKFYASLGNHDSPNQRFYEHFNMGGARYYTFKPAAGVRFFALDSNLMGPEQLAWLEKELAASGSDWRICFFHHPIYSSGQRHGADEELRQVLEPILKRHAVNVVFAGHEHFYERLEPQEGIYYFTSGGAGKLRYGNIGSSEITAQGLDRDYHFMLVEVAGNEMYFQAVSRTDKVVDSGKITRPERLEAPAAASGSQGR